ncbi:hypothetical protein MASR2M15_21310 [Anaerolineales bacterium]
MAYEIDWIIPDKVTRQHISGEIKLEDLPASFKEHAALLANYPYEIHTIIDLSDLTHYPTNLLKISQALNVKSPDNLGWMVFIGTSGTVRFLVKAVSQIIQYRVRNADSIAEAIQFLKEQDTSLIEEVS